MQSLEGKVAMVTGAGGSVGSYVTETLLQADLKVAVVYRSDRHRESLEKVREGYPGRVKILQADLNDFEQAEVAVTETIDTFGRVDFLVNPIGGWLGGKRLHEHSGEELDKMLNMDLKPTFHIMKSVLPVMAEQQDGKIINFSSMAVFGGQPGNAIYAASKAAVASLTEAAASEYGKDGIRCYALAPSTINSEANRNAMPDVDTSSWVDLEEIAEAIVYLCASGDSLSSTTLKFTGEIS
ncbi:MAG: SDR family oxidoreductase [Candidatus Marinimicrobia bacterium]|nr:SDR family oxidoreductase [Candidatus Neomarinimicrobiota bacterium]MCF7827434.1 SDR family oxidoreductase [Candidatus Neomarinimicrobiota bacterium]MCF7882309.1 SDR family oxidoreductase [Candidatus Neomarinimicrobiota bacterium]